MEEQQDVKSEAQRFQEEADKRKADMKAHPQKTETFARRGVEKKG